VNAAADRAPAQAEMKKMPLELARNVAVGGADEMQNLDDLAIASPLSCTSARLCRAKPLGHDPL